MPREIFTELEEFRFEAVTEVWRLVEQCRRPISDFGSEEVRNEWLAIFVAEAEDSTSRYLHHWNVIILGAFASERKKDGWSEERLNAAMARHQKDRSVFDWPAEFAGGGA